MAKVPKNLKEVKKNNLASFSFPEQQTIFSIES